MSGKAGELELSYGRLRVGEAMSPPLIEKVKEKIDTDRLVVTTVRGSTRCGRFVLGPARFS